MKLRINKWHLNVTGSPGCWQSFVQMGQGTRMHDQPSLSGIPDGAVVAWEAAPSAFVVDAHAVEGQVDGVGRGVVVWPEGWLLVRTVPHHEHVCSQGILRERQTPTFMLDNKFMAEQLLVQKKIGDLMTTVLMN